jgi:hypothetical protein
MLRPATCSHDLGARYVKDSQTILGQGVLPVAAYFERTRVHPKKFAGGGRVRVSFEFVGLTRHATASAISEYNILSTQRGHKAANKNGHDAGELQTSLRI